MIDTVATGDELFSVVRGGLKLRVRVTPHAKRATVFGIIDLPGCGPTLKVSVTVPAENGKANDALLKLLAKTWGLPKSSLTVVSGKNSRMKTVLIGDNSDVLQAWLQRAKEIR